MRERFKLATYIARLTTCCLPSPSLAAPDPRAASPSLPPVAANPPTKPSVAPPQRATTASGAKVSVFVKKKNDGYSRMEEDDEGDEEAAGNAGNGGGGRGGGKSAVDIWGNAISLETSAIAAAASKGGGEAAVPPISNNKPMRPPTRARPEKGKKGAPSPPPSPPSSTSQPERVQTASGARLSVFVKDQPPSYEDDSEDEVSGGGRLQCFCSPSYSRGPQYLTCSRLGLTVRSPLPPRQDEEMTEDDRNEKQLRKLAKSVGGTPIGHAPPLVRDHSATGLAPPVGRGGVANGGSGGGGGDGGGSAEESDEDSFKKAEQRRDMTLANTSRNSVRPESDDEDDFGDDDDFEQSAPLAPPAPAPDPEGAPSEMASSADDGSTGGNDE